MPTKRKEKHKVSDLTLDRRAVRAYLSRMEKQLASLNRPVAVGYARVSSKSQAEDGGSLEAQREAIIREAVLSGFDLLDVYSDGGISGGKGEDKRPGLNAALEAIKSGAASVLLVKHADRLARETDLAGFLKTSIKRAGGSIIVIDEIKNDPIRRAIDSMVGEIERIRASQRMKSWNAGRKAKGLPAGPPPYGLRVGSDGRHEAEPAEAGTVARIVELRRSEASLREIADELNRKRIPTRSGRPWNPMTVSSILAREL